MKARPPLDLVASVRQRLLNLAKERGEISISFSSGTDWNGSSFVWVSLDMPDRSSSKGAMLFPLWSGSLHRATKDMDLLGNGPPQIGRFVDVFREVAAIEETDGVVFLPETVAGISIREEARYDGIRITLEGRLGVAKLALQVDIGFGDAVTPAPTEMTYPALLGDPRPQRVSFQATSWSTSPSGDAIACNSI